MNNPMLTHNSLFSRRTLGGRVMSIMGIALLSSLILFALIVFYFVYRTESEAWRGRQSEAARNASGTVSGFMRRVEDSMNLLGVIELDRGGEFSLEAQTFLDQNPAFLEIISTDSRGIVTASAYRDKNLLANLITIPQSQWFLQARRGMTYIGNVQLSANNEPYLIMAVPRRDGGVVAARVKMDVLWDVVDTIHFGDSGQAYVIAHTGQIIAHTRPEVVYSSTTIQDRAEFRAFMAAPENEWFGTFTNFEGVPVVGSTRSIEGTEWVVVTELPVTEAFASTQNAIFILGSIAFLLLFITNLIVARNVRQQITSPMERLRVGAELA
jgi:hypothetical protein